MIQISSVFMILLPQEMTIIILAPEEVSKWPVPGLLHEIQVPFSNIIFYVHTCFYQRGQNSGIVHPVTWYMSHLAWLWSTFTQYKTKITRRMNSLLSVINLYTADIFARDIHFQNGLYLYMCCFLLDFRIRYDMYIRSTKLISADLIGFTRNCQTRWGWNSTIHNVCDTEGTSNFAGVSDGYDFPLRWFWFRWPSWLTAVWASWQPVTHRIGSARVLTHLRGSQFSLFRPSFTSLVFQ